MSPPTVEALLADVCGEIRDGDLLAFVGSGWIGGTIAWAGRSQYSHVGMAAWWGDELMCLELREFRGGRAVTLASQVARGGKIDVYRPDVERYPEFVAAAAVAYMRRFAGRNYSYLGVAKLVAVRLPYLRRRYTTDLNDSLRATDGLPAFCSWGVNDAYQHGGGVDPVPNLAGRDTEPGDLARSKFFRPVVTLIG